MTYLAKAAALAPKFAAFDARQRTRTCALKTHQLLSNVVFLLPLVNGALLPGRSARTSVAMER